ncbi:MAG: MFS transporter [Firmicutes bacterium]|nr:MFS transporter [Bacillota bacterium]
MKSTLSKRIPFDSFHAFLVGRFFSRVGDKLFLVALPLVVQSMGYGAPLLSFANALQYVANWVGGPLGAHLTDRHSRRTMMLSVHVVQAVAVVGVVASMANKTFFPFLLLVSMFLLHLASMVNRVNRFSLTTLFRDRDRLAAANAEIQLMESTARLLGPLAAGVVIAHLHLRMALWLDVLSFVVMGVVVVFAVRLQRTKEESRRSSYQLCDLWRWRYEGPPDVRRMLMVNALSSGVFAFVSGFNVFLMRSAHHFDVMTISVILTLTAVASMLLGFVLRLNVVRLAQPSVAKMAWGLSVCGVGLLGMPFTQKAPVYFLSYTLCILGMEYYQQQGQTWLQIHVPQTELNRAFVAMSNAANIMAAVWMVIGGLLWRIVAPYLPLLICSVMLFTNILICVLSLNFLNSEGEQHAEL